MLGQRSIFLTHAANKIKKKHTYLIARKKLVVVAIFHRNANTVCIGIGRKKQIGVNLLTQCNTALQSFTNLRIRIRARREIAIGLRLLFDYMNISNTNTFQNTRYALQARAIQRRVYHAQIRLFLFYMLVIYGIEKGIEHFFLNICCITRSLGILERHSAHVVKHVDAFYCLRDCIGDLRGDLTTIRTVNLVAIVFTGIMACRNVNADSTTQITCSE